VTSDQTTRPRIVPGLLQQVCSMAFCHVFRQVVNLGSSFSGSLTIYHVTFH